MPFRVGGTSGANLCDIFVTEEVLVNQFTGHELWLWGRNTNGPLGDNTTITKSSPVQTISGGTNWRSVAAGGTSFYASAALRLFSGYDF
jgi:Regulator of chromosome condensation (RCC1) repeat